MIFEPEISVPDNLTGSERRRVSKLLKIVELPHVRYQILKGSDRILREAGIDSRLVREEDGEALIIVAAALAYSRLSQDHKNFVLEGAGRFGKKGRGRLKGRIQALAGDRLTMPGSFPATMSDKEIEEQIPQIKLIGQGYNIAATKSKGASRVLFKAMARAHKQAQLEYQKEQEHRSATRKHDLNNR